MTSEELKKRAVKGDVTELIRRYYGGPCTNELWQIQQVGYIACAKSWLISMQPEKMFQFRMLGEPYPSYQRVEDRNGKIQVGRYSLGQRLSAAYRWAGKAQIPLEQIARAYGLQHLLDTPMETEPDSIRYG